MGGHTGPKVGPDLADRPARGLLASARTWSFGRSAEGLMTKLGVRNRFELAIWAYETRRVK
jgi:hypothetical protein